MGVQRQSTIQPTSAKNETGSELREEGAEGEEGTNENENEDRRSGGLSSKRPCP